MSHASKLVDEPVVDSGAQYCVGALSEDEIKGHRSKPTMPFGLPSVDEGAFPHDTGVSHGMYPVHRHRRRRKRLTGQTSEGDSKMYPTDPSEHVMFLLGECDGEEEEPHHLFCELDELWHDPATAVETEWREAARWIKFEEAVEENGERWSKPHVATLPLFSLFELRNCLTNAVIMLNLEAYSMEQVADLVLNVLVSENHLPAELRDRLLDVLLLRHIHLHDRVRGRSATNLPLIRSVADIGKRQSSKEVDKELTSQHSLAKFPTFTGIDNLDPSVAAHGTADAHAHAAGHSEALSGSLQGKYDLHFLKKIAPGSETANILVGETTFLTEPISVFVRLHEAVLLGDLTEVPVPTRFLFLHLGVMGNALKYREIGRSMGVLMSDEVFHDVAYKAKSRVDLLAGLDEFLSVAIVLPPGEWDPSIRIEPPPSVPSQDSRKTGVAPNGPQTAPVSTISQPDQGMVLDQLCAGGDRLAGLCLAAIGSIGLPNLEEEKELGEPTGTTKIDGHGADSNLDLNTVEAVSGLATGVHDEAPGGHGLDPSLQRTGRLFGGLVKDIKRRAPFYLSDFTDALHVQCCASFIFLYFACLTPIITFGGLLSQATGGYLGTIESILSGAVVGVLYALFSGQPLTIMGSTGPVLIFEGIIFKMCQRMQWAYLSFRLWIGFWVALFLLIMVALDLSALVKYITRFTEESFAALIAFIFIIEAFKKIFAISKYYPVDLSWTPEAVPRHNCSCLTPMNLTDSDVLAVMYDQHPLSDVPLMIKNGTSVRYSGSDMDIVNFTSMRIDWESISAGRYSWDSLQYRTLCTDLNGTWTGGSCAPFYVPDVFFFSCILFIVTFSLATGLKSMRTSPFFPARARAFIADFSVVIAITLTTLTDFFVSLHTPKLQVPAEFAPTLGYKKRGWIIHPFETNPWWTSLVALGPALVATILIFMDQQITAVIINRQENKLKKGAGYHLDLLVVAVTIAINSVLGIPWFVAATVLSINHLLSLKKESEVSAPGERPVYLGCREQRVTAFLIFLMIGLSVFMTRLLSCIPMAVLYGIFLFMGISSLHGVQMVERIGLMFMPIKYQPDYSFLRHVSLRRVHMYTVVQVTCFIMLWVIKSVEVVSILFPIMVLAMCFIRKGLDFIFTQDELKWLDEILPGTRTKRNSRNVYRVTSSGEMLTKDGKLMIGSGLHLEPKEKRINITEEVSKTTIWRQLSGADVKDGAHVPPKYKAKDSKKRHHRRKAPKTVDSHSGEHRVLVQNEQPAEEVNKPVLFCIDPKEQEQHSKSPWNIGDVEEEYGDEGGQSAKAQRSLPAPLITINPPSVHDSLEAMRRQPMV